MEQQQRTRIDPGRVLLAVALAAVGAPVVWAAVQAVIHYPQPVYRLTPVLLVVTLGACAVILLTLGALRKQPHAGLAAGVLLVVCLWVLSFISAIGVVTLPLAVALTVAVLVASRRVGGGAGQAVLPAVAVAVSLAVLLVTQPWTAAVRCGDSAVRTSGRPSDGAANSSSGSGTGTARVPGSAGGTGMDATGNVTFGEQNYSYRCADGELVEFRRVGGVTPPTAPTHRGAGPAHARP